MQYNCAPEATVFVITMVIVGMLAIWGNWIWIGKDGYSLPVRLTPGFFRFYLVIIPRFLLGLGLPADLKAVVLVRSDFRLGGRYCARKY